MMARRGHGEGSIYRRKDGRWCAAVTIGRDATGRLKRRYVYGDTRREVQEQLTKLLADAQSGLPIDPTRQTVAEFLNAWLEDCVRGNARPNTVESYRNTIKHIVPAIGNIPLSKLTPQHLQRLYREKQEAGFRRTVVLIHAVVHKALAQAVKWGLIARNVADAVERPKVPKKDFRALTTEEARRFLSAAEHDRLYALYVLAITTGLREGELLGLKWDDINWAEGTVTIVRQLQWLRPSQGENLQPLFVAPKSAKSRRSVVLPAVALAALRRHRTQQSEERLGLGSVWQDHGLVFCTEVGTPIVRGNLIRRSFKPLLQKAGLPDIRFHDLRHTAATLLLAQGTHPKLVQEMLGHSQISITLDIYSHVTAPMMRETARKMDELLAARPNRRR